MGTPDYCIKFRGSISCPHFPLSTLPEYRCRHPDMTQGRRGLLILRRIGLSPTILRQLLAHPKLSIRYRFYIGDQSEADEVLVRFFDGHPSKNNQIGSDQRIALLLPLEFKNVSVAWNVKKLRGLHKIYVQAYPGKNAIKALGHSKPSISFIAIDLDSYRKSKND